MKKKQKVADDHPEPDPDMKSIIHQNSLFFDKLIELIPARFYLSTDGKERPWFQGLSKAEKASAKKQSRENIKRARRDRLDPGKSSSTTLDLLKQSLENEKINADKSNSEGDDHEVEINPKFSGLDDDNCSVTYEQLMQKLHRRIKELQGRRGNGGSSDGVKKKNAKRELRGRKRKAISGFEDEKEDAFNNDNIRSMDEVEKDASEAAKELAFGHVKLGNKAEDGKKKRRKKLSKLQELERAKKLDEVKKDPEKGDVVSRKHSWQAATSRAAGIKVHDDPKLLERSIKKEKKRHHKNAEKWKERAEAQQRMKADKQQTRAENIAERIHQKKMRRIAKREKKLMRPGFEGRKEGYINDISG